MGGLKSGNHGIFNKILQNFTKFHKISQKYQKISQIYTKFHRSSKILG